MELGNRLFLQTPLQKYRTHTVRPVAKRCMPLSIRHRRKIFLAHQLPLGVEPSRTERPRIIRTNRKKSYPIDRSSAASQKPVIGKTQTCRDGTGQTSPPHTSNRRRHYRSCRYLRGLQRYAAILCIPKDPRRLFRCICFYGIRPGYHIQ